MKKTLLLSAAIVASLSAFGQDYLAADYYMIGSNVNGHSWAFTEADCKFENKGAGIFEWNGEYLGTGFKINNGAWEDAFNFGAGQKLVLDEPYFLTVAGSSGNIDFAEKDGVAFAGLKNPKVVLDVTKAPDEVTIVVSGEMDGVIQWYFTGTFNDWSIAGDTAYVLEDLGDKKYEVKGVNIFPSEETGYAEFKITSTGWGEQFGAYYDNEEANGVVFGAGVDEGILDVVGGEGGGCQCYYDGTYDIKWDGNTHTISFTEAGGDLVNEISAANGKAVYYNLQGARVANPENGIFIQTLNGKSSKVLIRK